MAYEGLAKQTQKTKDLKKKICKFMRKWRNSRLENCLTFTKLPGATLPNHIIKFKSKWDYESGLFAVLGNTYHKLKHWVGRDTFVDY